MHHPIFHHNLKAFAKSGQIEWIPYLANFQPLTFIAYQGRPPLTAILLIKVFSWQITMESIEKLQIKLVSVFMDMAASILDPTVRRNVQKIVKDIPRHLLPTWFMLWILMLVVITNSYEGMIYLHKWIPY